MTQINSLVYWTAKFKSPLFYVQQPCYVKGPVTLQHIFLFLRRACVLCILPRWIKCGPPLIVSGCASKAVCVWFYVNHESACIVYASSMRGTRVGCQCLCVKTGPKRRTSTDAPPSYHAWTAHVSLSFHWHSRSVHMFGPAPSVIHALGVRQLFMEY